MVEDRLLIWRFKHGNRDALRRIYQKYKNDLLKLAVALVSDAGVAEDVVQDVFVSFALHDICVDLRYGRAGSCVIVRQAIYDAIP